ncbi:related to inhibitor of calcineurin [Ramularia collo-cygni]|uniref:Related to inhibitor of calcineurin n=1 Tax=Ramularia collo-cygni TaxID=112498 RepID=A0A2D3V311_9PEZI|nr:related to inhibitor of calcineurin [Ramularia collo-cygni]CZT24657.1 related to inhibitor of calcineurin [Ramularia collo-cygni]
MQAIPTPPHSRRRSPNLSIDLSSLPQLSTPAPPSNTLLITNLTTPAIFTAINLESITQAINAHAPIHTFSPLKSMRRIIVTFHTVADAIAVRQLLDGETVLGDRIRVYFGANTRIEDPQDQHLQAPKSSRLFFISPPPSPPMGWEMRNEGPPNKDVHAEDLASALANLTARPSADDALYQQSSGTFAERKGSGRKRAATLGAGSTVVYDPEEFGDSPDLPAIAVEDTTMSPLPLTPVEGSGLKLERTARPPVELME